ncbi:hypothetical protein CFR75_01925 [Komagataeibacter xylinus]|uniref:Uncharacterized protein n=1 Tax=Komagataeibacter xylinus TaxID=28448 RepID=A0A318PQ61_KOMXY|nr:hypothetical protein [Komagataeibacter xylinus]PYD58492.1 hypothetical protein CFR75_01925 [Komagataeibacter xylinus]
MAFSGSASETRCVTVHRLDRAARPAARDTRPDYIHVGAGDTRRAGPMRNGQPDCQPFPCHHVRRGAASSLREDAIFMPQWPPPIHPRAGRKPARGQALAFPLAFPTRIAARRHPH